MSYTAPVKDMMYTMEHLAGLQTVTALPGMSDFDQETAQAVLEESAKFCQDVVAPLNWTGDQQPSSWEEQLCSKSSHFEEAPACG